MHSAHFVMVIWHRTLVKGHWDSESRNLLLPLHELQGMFNTHHPTDWIAQCVLSSLWDGVYYTSLAALVTPVVEHWLEQEIAKWVHQEGLPLWDAHTYSCSKPRDKIFYRNHLWKCVQCVIRYNLFSVFRKGGRNLQYLAKAGVICDLSGTTHSQKSWKCKEGKTILIRLEDSKVYGCNWFFLCLIIFIMYSHITMVIYCYGLLKCVL